MQITKQALQELSEIIEELEAADEIEDTYDQAMYYQLSTNAIIDWYNRLIDKTSETT